MILIILSPKTNKTFPKSSPSQEFKELRDGIKQKNNLKHLKSEDNTTTLILMEEISNKVKMTLFVNTITDLFMYYCPGPAKLVQIYTSRQTNNDEDRWIICYQVTRSNHAWVILC